MSNKKSRVELMVDVLDRPGQRALALPVLTPEEFIAATLQEFRDVELLGTDPRAYVLVDAASGAELERTRPFEELNAAGLLHVQLRERAVPLPKGARAPSQPIYLEDPNTGAVHKLNWLPAIIGRPDATQPNNHLLAVDLQSSPSGLRVSRRHAMITEDGGRFAVQTLSGNPVTLRRNDGSSEAVFGRPVPLQSGDVLYLNRSEIALTFLIRQPGIAEAAAAQVPGQAYPSPSESAGSTLEENTNG